MHPFLFDLLIYLTALCVCSLYFSIYFTVIYLDYCMQSKVVNGTCFYWNKKYLILLQADVASQFHKPVQPNLCRFTSQARFYGSVVLGKFTRWHPCNGRQCTGPSSSWSSSQKWTRPKDGGFHWTIQVVNVVLYLN